MQPKMSAFDPKQTYIAIRS